MTKKFRFWALTLALACACGLALAAAQTLTLSGDQPVAKQARAFAAYLDSLPEKARQEWMGELEKLLETASDAPFAGAQKETRLVWVSNSGKRYHGNPSCSNMKNPQEISLEDAVSRGLTPCKKCGGR